MEGSESIGNAFGNVAKTKTYIVLSLIRKLFRHTG